MSQKGTSMLFSLSSWNSKHTCSRAAEEGGSNGVDPRSRGQGDGGDSRAGGVAGGDAGRPCVSGGVSKTKKGVSFACEHK